ncbi:GTP-binding nuclear protein Ran [Nematocida homosporus]|uniref:GTP-binding nuclear protein Ran n=1 Tax=Nematocida homosporus TaxID=1912981 RepID=UPI0022211B97|nr:GTP-binding nuclear protein Ran [Nematocida homosporus]KAI5186047.1 GTP-binding nuclear protein Ran [Nematocida homosporus]
MWNQQNDYQHMNSTPQPNQNQPNQNQPQPEIPVKKIVLIGDGGTGKTTFVKRHITGEFTRKYVATIGADTYLLPFFTNYGQVNYNLWDTAGQEKYGGLRDAYYIGADGAIIMFDTTSRITYKNVPNWYRDLRNICPTIPVCICGNKVDVIDRKVKPANMKGRKGMVATYFDISAKSNYNYDKPFLFFSRKIFNLPDLFFVANSNLLPPEATVDEVLLEKMQKEFEDASEQALPDFE